MTCMNVYRRQFWTIVNGGDERRSSAAVRAKPECVHACLKVGEGPLHKEARVYVSRVMSV